MHYGVYVGRNFENQNKRILILGESHHGKEEEKGKPAKYTSSDVVNKYMSAKRGVIKMERSWYFFTKIAHAFDASFNTQDIIGFWESVAFGNYVDVVCGVKDDYAKSYIYKEENRKKLNSDLFSFINSNKIDVIVCVSKLVFYALPNQSIINDNHRVMVSQFISSETYENELKLYKDLSVYSIPHPSGFGFKPITFNNVLKRLLDKT